MSFTKPSPELSEAIEACFQDPDIRNRPYYAEFRRSWGHVLSMAAKSETVYFDPDSDRCYPVESAVGEVPITLHIDQLKIAEWYEKESASRKHVVFFGKRLKRSRKTGELLFHDAVCLYDPAAEEPALQEAQRNIIACALPCNPPVMKVVYGNKWVETRFHPLRRNTLDIFFIGTDYVPAFLATPYELALYLFLMDYYIIKTNLGKAKDEDIQKLLHITRPSPMLRLKGLA